MRHGKTGVKLGRTASHREAMFRNMVTSLFKSPEERIRTTDAKAKELRRVAEKMITLAKRGDLHARRQALSYIRDKDVVARLFNDFPERYKDRMGGYTRIVKIGNRVGDNAPVSIIECIKDDVREKPKRKAASKKS